MLNKFQIDIIKYLETTADHFIEFLIEKYDSQFIIIDNLVPELKSYLGNMIKRDLDLHAQHSEGFNMLEDMLIEIHLPSNDEFLDALIKTALTSI